LPRSLFKRSAKIASVSATGVPARAFISRSKRLSASSRESTSSSLRPSIRSVSLRSVACVYGISPKEALRSAFLKIKRAATAAKFRRMAERLAQIASKGSGSTRPASRKSGLHQTQGTMPVVSNRRLQ
jgi:hypothetical protein